MWFIAIVLSLVISLSEFDLFVGISDISEILNSLCLNFTPKSLNKEIYSALICGKALSSQEFSQDLKNLGIYHVIIVSGSHLIFLSILVEKIFYSTRFSFFRRSFKFIVFLILTTYALATGAEAPVIRALIGLAINDLQKKRKLFWSQNEVILMSVLFCLFLFDPWKKSYSLILSYVASIALSLSQDTCLIRKNIKIYSFIFPFLLPLSAPHPLSFLTNMILSPVIGVILFPLSLLSFVIPYLYLAVDPLWDALQMICTIIAPELPGFDRFPLSILLLWTLAFSLNFYGIYSEKRGNHVAS